MSVHMRAHTCVGRVCAQAPGDNRTRSRKFTASRHLPSTCCCAVHLPATLVTKSVHLGRRAACRELQDSEGRGQFPQEQGRLPWPPRPPGHTPSSRVPVWTGSGRVRMPVDGDCHLLTSSPGDALHVDRPSGEAQRTWAGMCIPSTAPEVPQTLTGNSQSPLGQDRHRERRHGSPTPRRRLGLQETVTSQRNGHLVTSNSGNPLYKSRNTARK
uniref:Uncharacterized protein n=1 Tax=Molossus molossus TaxID=27622 RepID=A0A7J8EF38_MOLMO|nr:hypothetical protein HJG59_008791 [Molossus molossus]